MPGLVGSTWWAMGARTGLYSLENQRRLTGPRIAVGTINTVFVQLEG